MIIKNASAHKTVNGDFNRNKPFLQQDKKNIKHKIYLKNVLFLLCFTVSELIHFVNNKISLSKVKLSVSSYRLNTSKIENTIYVICKKEG